MISFQVRKKKKKYNKAERKHGRRQSAFLLFCNKKGASVIESFSGQAPNMGSREEGASILSHTWTTMDEEEKQRLIIFSLILVVQLLPRNSWGRGGGVSQMFR